MDIGVILSNYRCFSDTPIRFAMKPGLQAFVGINNSGKSCMLRFFYEFRNVFAALSNPGMVWQALTNNPPQNFSLMPLVKDREEMFHDRNERDIIAGFELEDPTESATMPTRFEITLNRSTQNWRIAIFTKEGSFSPQGLGMQNHDGRFVASRSAGGSVTPRLVLNPISDACAVMHRALYLGPFRNAVNIGGSGDYYDIQIGQPFITSWRTLKTGYQKKQSEATYKLTEDIRRIFGFESLDINASDDGQNLQLMVDGHSYKQSEIGSGLIQFILVLVNAAIRKPTYILIDEPELNLHPSLQVDFLTTLAAYAEHGVLFATHNLGLARAVSDRVYSVRHVKHGREVRDFTGTPALAEFLGELGYNAYRDLGFETVLLVEGPTEVTCIQQLLRIYKKEHNIVLLHLGGASTINASCDAQLEQITRISPKIYALIDSERTKVGEPLASGRQGFAEVCSKLKIPCTVLDRRAMENYFPTHAIQAIKGDKYRALAPYETLKDANPAWGKAENWKIARQMTESDLRGTDLGMFLEKL